MKSLTAKDKKRNLALMHAVMQYCSQHSLASDVWFYTNGRVFCLEKPLDSQKIQQVCHEAGLTYYDCGECDVESQLEYSNPKTLTMTFEGPFYDMYNYGTGKTESDITKIAAEFGLYPEQGYAWSLAFYD